MRRRAERFQRESSILKGRVEADVAIVGGGLSGLTAALWLSRAGLRVAVAEAGELGAASLERCMGAVSTVGGSCVQLRKKLGQHGAEACIETSRRAFHTLREWLEPLGQWVGQDAYLLFSGRPDRLEEEWSAMRQLGLTKNARAEKAASAICLPEAGMIRMMDYAKLLQEECIRHRVMLFEHSRVLSMEINEVYTRHGSIHAPCLLVATGYPVLNMPGWYFAWLIQREYAWRPLRDGAFAQGWVMDAETGTSVITDAWGGRLLCRCGRVADGDNLRQAEGLARAMLEGSAAQLTGNWHFSSEVHTPDGLALIGPYAEKTPNLFVAGAYGGRGLLGSVMAAQAISRRILGLPSSGYEIYAPDRLYKQWRPPVQAAARYARTALFPLHAPRCPHMGCRLLYNSHTQMWECPCHGSRFDDIGHVVAAPAVHDAVLRDRR